ncbi:cytochrome c-type biogenesis protein CcmH [Acetobacteraceae bacterium KSS8]|uniref:Cytochrome c-type biogenesis protein n=1 Tax=Endosaccharibacter trunci TaxID=2812733 RepID=A0ABT1W2C8_9PROT|nr:cytochrome c-type biogenesis protein CcmH [Acetobacteraceae bacterium KSS8]
MKRLLPIVFVALLLPGPVLAVSDPSEMLPNPAQEKRAEALGSRLRCLVCQNESIEDSDASLARELRHILREHVAAGESDAEITRWMVARYGGFIRLEPAFNATTAMLWCMPVLALLFGLGIAVWSYRRASRRAAPAPALDAAEQARLDALLRGGSVER